jgi:uncharacterized protein (TIGR03643 family)
VNESSAAISELIEMAWQDRITFDDIQRLTGYSESEVIRLMRAQLKPSSYRLWRKRVTGRVTKHKKKCGMAHE